ncbi:hypothetical protein BGZ89_008146, partial [Linnemannia elongata]
AYWKHHTLIPYKTHVDEVIDLMQWEIRRQAKEKQQWEAEQKRLQKEKIEEYCRRQRKQDQDEVLSRFYERKRAETSQNANSALKSDVASKRKDASKFEDPSDADKPLAPKKPIRPRPLRKANVVSLPIKEEPETSAASDKVKAVEADSILTKVATKRKNAAKAEDLPGTANIPMSLSENPFNLRPHKKVK